MTDPIGLVLRLVGLVLSPAMLLAPLLFVLLSPTRMREGAGRAEARARSLALGLATLLALALWLGALLAGANLRSEPLALLARFAWVMFFPLWFLLAMPLVRAKNPSWAPFGATPSAVRTASLSDRSRASPIRRSHGLVAGAACVLLLAGIAARGAVPFESEALRGRWLLSLGTYAATLLAVALAVPWALRLALREPEPIDPEASLELARRYQGYRDAKILALFWLLGAALPLFHGACLAVAVWLPGGSVLAWVGAAGGSALGLAGAWLGVSLGLRRARIAEFREELARARTAPRSHPG